MTTAVTVGRTVGDGLGVVGGGGGGGGGGVVVGDGEGVGDGVGDGVAATTDKFTCTAVPWIGGTTPVPAAWPLTINVIVVPGVEQPGKV